MHRCEESAGCWRAVIALPGAEKLHTVHHLVDRAELGGIAVSLGDVKTLVYPMPKRDNLIRVSVGCEGLADLVADFEQALAHA